jgi:two-component system, chemotaxis family, chemotaxis protein CheY
MNVLVAEDNRISRELLRRMIETGGRHTVTVVHDGEEAWNALSKPDSAFDVCILDIYMPKLSGLELIERLNKDDRLKHISIVLCSSADDRVTVQRAMALGVTHYIVKPYNKALVLDRLDQIAAEFEASRMLEDPKVVCERLGIDADLHRELLEALAIDVLEWCVQMRAARAAAEAQALYIRGQGIRGSCLNLGAIRASVIIGDLEAHLQEISAKGPAAETLFTSVPLCALVDDLERGARMVASRIKKAA